MRSMADIMGTAPAQAAAPQPHRVVGSGSDPGGADRARATNGAAPSHTADAVAGRSVRGEPDVDRRPVRESPEAAAEAGSEVWTEAQV